MEILISERIKQKRIEQGLTQRQLAEKASTTATTISAYEKGIKKPSIENIINIARVLNVSIDWLCGLSEHKKEETKKTLKDIAEMLFDFESATDLEISYYSVGSGSGFFDDFIDVYGFCLDNKSEKEVQEFEKFLNNWIKTKKLFKEKTIDNELYELWKEKELKKLSQYNACKLNPHS